MAFSDPGADEVNAPSVAPKDGELEWPAARSLPKARPNLTSVPLDENVAIYDEVGQVLVMLNPTAGAVLDSCTGTATFEAIVAGLAAEHGADAAAIRDDVWRTLRKLASMGLVADAT